MRLGISGKGGVGKTTISAVVARTLARQGHRVIAIDCDSDPNLGANIGLGEDGAARMRPFLDQSGATRRVPAKMTPANLLDLSWAGGTLRYVDLLLVVLQPTVKVLVTAARTCQLASQLGIREVAFVGTKAEEADRARLEEFAGEWGGELLALVPDDEAVRQADRVAGCVLDTAPGSPAVRAMEALAGTLVSRPTAGGRHR